ncbi:hypothetical protein D3C76_1204810 [compost metagenome]
MLVSRLLQLHAAALQQLRKALFQLVTALQSVTAQGSDFFGAEADNHPARRGELVDGGPQRPRRDAVAGGHGPGIGTGQQRTRKARH